MLHTALVAFLSFYGCSTSTDKTGQGLGPETHEPEPVREGPGKQPGFKTGPIVDPVNFESGSADIREGEAKSIDKAAEVAKSGNWKVLLVGLADESGDVEMNRALTKKRCDAVAAALSRHGIPAPRISQYPLGERLATDVNNVRQRKVEFVFYQGGGNLPEKEIAQRSRVLEADYREHRQEEQH